MTGSLSYFTNKQMYQLQRKMKTWHQKQLQSMKLCKSFTSCQAQIVGATKGKHFSYVLHITSKDQQWLVYRRYSEFRRFRDSILRSLSQNRCNGSCQYLKRLRSINFPRKRIFHANDNSSVIRQRTIQLNVFLQTILFIVRRCTRKAIRSCNTMECDVMKLVQEFFQISSLEQSTIEFNRKRSMFPPSSSIYHLTNGAEVLTTGQNPGPLYTILEEQVMHHAHAI